MAFTGDTSAEWIRRATATATEGGEGEGDVDVVARDALRAKLLICECTFVDDAVSPEGARDFGHTHIDELAAAARDGKFQNEAVLLIHFSARYRGREIEDAIAEKFPEEFAKRVTPLLVGFAP